ncbi:GNAT family N-acetyltransferase [Aliiroseovarius sp. 2305UL8-7]|uniref:GNAT family N-acetyltransferase n=1 Tax=Aliiroseovarius conchicola TaxID=3121637 RepID=UPI0035280596
MIRRAETGDEAPMEAFLAAHAETSMFLRSNLRQFGLSGADDPRATTYWLADEGTRIAAVFGISNGGFVMSQAPAAAPRLWDIFTSETTGRNLIGMTGATEQVEAAKRAMGVQSARYSLDRDEPLYRLSLNDLITPRGDEVLRPATPDDLDILTDWVIDYDTTALGLALTDELRARARITAQAHIGSDAHHILELDGLPVAKTAFNASLPDLVQIGGVYTPPALRARGHARRAVALHLQEARSRGVNSAILFASGRPACRAYEAIGFERIGTYKLSILETQHRIGTGA